MGLPVFDLSSVIKFGAETARASAYWLATKVFVYAFSFVALPLILFNVWLYVGEKILTAVAGFLSQQSFYSGAIVDLTGLAGWLGQCLRFSDCLSVLLTAATVRFILGVARV